MAVTLGSSLGAQATPDAFVRWARAHAKPLATVESRQSSTDLVPFRAIVGSARVVAIGEPIHGAHEPLAFRNRLFRYLVEREGFTAIAIESSLPDSRAVDAFVSGGPGVAEDIAHRFVGYGFGDFAETVELLRWMRSYNADKSHARKLHFYGIDLPLGGSDGGTPRAGAFEIPLSLLARVDTGNAARLKRTFEPILRLTDDSVLSLAPASVDTLLLAADDLVARLERSGSVLTPMSRTDFDWGLRSAIVARQTMRVHHFIPAATAATLSPGIWEALETRDFSMADNVKWALSREGDRGRILVFAHNGHIQNAATAGSVWDSLAQPPKTLGIYLKSMFGRDAVIIGQVGGASTGDLARAEHDSLGLDEALVAVGQRRFVLDLRPAKAGSAERRWLEQSHPMRANMAMHQRLRPASAFDALVFLDTLHPARRATPAKDHH
jgi:erythromycin esterase